MMKALAPDARGLVIVMALLAVAAGVTALYSLAVAHVVMALAAGLIAVMAAYTAHGLVRTAPPTDPDHPDRAAER